nr:lysozyme inhibitor LprI family protein [Pantoea cypripedii]
MNKSVVIASLLALYQCYANAQDVCSHAVSDSENFACRKEEKITSEKILNTEYLAAKKRIGDEYKSSPVDLNNYLDILTKSQRGWLIYRDGQCNLESFLAEKGTIVHDTLNNTCISRIDMERVEQLKTIPYN